MRKPVKSVIWACAFTLAVDLIITELWMDVRPLVMGVAYADLYNPTPFLPPCNMIDGRDIDFAMLWQDGKPKCVDVAKGQVRS